MSNFFLRTITGILFVIVIVGSAILNFWVFAAVFGVFTILGLWEFYNLISKTGIKPSKISGTLIGFAVYSIAVVSQAGLIDKYLNIFYLIIFTLSILFFFVELYKSSETPFQNISLTFLGIIYIAIPFSLLISMVNLKTENTGFFTLPVLYFFIIWTYDTFAYIVGIKFGKNRLFESISPKKSWEGAIGGIFFSFVLAYILSGFYEFISLYQWLGLAAIIVVFGTLGDLTESMLKRSINCKDSGNFFPGHGGILDRFDSVLLSAPFVFIYLKIIELI